MKVSLSSSSAMLILLLQFVLLVLFADAHLASVYGPEFGGPHGDDFDDSNGFDDEMIESIKIRSGRRVDRVEFKTNYQTFSHGGDGGGERTLDLDLNLNETIKEYMAWTGKRSGKTTLFRVVFKTSEGRSIGGGGETDHYHYFKVPEGFVAYGMHGRSGKSLNKMGLVLHRKDE